MAESKSAALPLGYAPKGAGEPHRTVLARGGRTIAAPTGPINAHYSYYINRGLTGLRPRLN